MLPAEEDPVAEEPVVESESTPPPRIDERAPVVTEEEGAGTPRPVRQVGEDFATEWPAAGTGSAPPRLAVETPDETPPDEAVADAPPVLSEAEVAALTGIEPSAEPVEADAAADTAAVAAEDAPPPEAEATEGVEPPLPGPGDAGNVAVTLPLGHFEFSGTAATASGAMTPRLADLAPVGSSTGAEESAVRVPRARPQPTAAAYRQVPPREEPVRTRSRSVVVAEAYEAPRPRRQASAQPPVVYRQAPLSAYDRALADGYVIIQQDQARYFRPRPGRVYVVPAQPRRYQIIGRVPGW